jgi:carbonic anhydrase
MPPLSPLLKSNRRWAERMTTEDPQFFEKLVGQQSPDFLWIGCADSRVPANEIVGLLPGELFVHRNVANVVVHTDLNCLSVLQYAVDALQVEHVIVCGHYGCGGVAASLSRKQYGIIDNWLGHIKDVYRLHSAEIDAIQEHDKKVNRLIELNVQEQVFNLCATSIIQNAWKERNDLAVHGMIINIGTGELIDQHCTFTNNDELGEVFAYK